MRTRAIVNGNVVWFGSAGLGEYDRKIPANNFAEKQQHVVDGLRQRLSIIKGELWYKMNYGLPLLDKISSKAVVDASVLDIVNSQEDVKEILSFTSRVVNHEYTCNMQILTIYGEISISI